jgi:hypothetical protein
MGFLATLVGQVVAVSASEVGVSGAEKKLSDSLSTRDLVDLRRTM